MRQVLDRIYGGALMLSAILFATIAVLVLIQVGGRLTDRVLRAAGSEPLGITIPSLAEIGGFLFISAVFLGLAGTLVRGGHVRVTLVTRALPEGVARGLDGLVALGAAGLAAFASWSSILQTIDSWKFDSLSFGMVKIPLWWPQSVMTLGLLLLTVALIDAALTRFRGGLPPYAEAEAVREEGH